MDNILCEVYFYMMKYEIFSVGLIWHKKDENDILKYVDAIGNMLSVDNNYPFSRNINLPTFYYSNLRNNEVPPEISVPDNSKMLAFAFVGKNIVSDDEWCLYIEDITKNNSVKLVCIALDDSAFKISSEISKFNFIRFYEYTDNEELRLNIACLHEIYRVLINEKTCEDNSDNRVIIFLSHTKKDEIGVNLAKSLRRIICEDTVLQKFFDQNDILPSELFDEKIKQCISKSTIIAINTDHYSASYWCQCEIIEAKHKERPIIEINLIKENVDRKFPVLGNIPVVRCNDAYSNRELFNILQFALIETVRSNYALIFLRNVASCMNLHEDNIKFLSRPPEVFDYMHGKTIMYPDPPIYSEETREYNFSNSSVITPLTHKKFNLNNIKVGISISEPAMEELICLGMRNKHVEVLSKVVAKYMIGLNATLIYGGDLRENGVTQFLIDEARITTSMLNCKKVCLYNYVAWPIYLKDNVDKCIKWKADNRDILKIKNSDINELLDKYKIDSEQFLPPDTTLNLYIWGKSLTKMRENMIKECDFRICAGGCLYGYKGKMPGVLEEFIIAIKMKKPIFLLGGFGGVGKRICDIINNGSIPKEFTPKWQIENNINYRELMNFYKENDEEINYENILKEIQAYTFNNGLSLDENNQLMTTVYPEEAVMLITKGIRKIISKET